MGGSKESKRCHSETGPQDGTVQVWDAASGRHLLTSPGHTSLAWAVAWSPGGVCLASATGSTSGERRMETVQMSNTMTGHRYMNYPIPPVQPMLTGP